ncbi:GerAB/ArcD/ProY family transporter [Niallia taxi]|uniref:Spore gernimation protein KC n=1 Tax=Niallia taxi TaxID=2499688 RepID=A0A437K6R9_9BACI|nr:GerAB/ArcD/ProY family transporter [Niallia taxi]MCM3217407.1 spore germination protein [Niallia taxi]MDK8641398.1 GerAB/ArcD/ProY family transporter [Niallia taxi]MED4039464.1 GerAB/ArcD/ProY family transporter [Niallia taxi]MED4055722.1 GerAB/ArcD/ProY family transporter [Niallia taxi]MED4121384.1 GerAB/ArcD/ProY family transporter [Niallia taxi]
MLKENISLSQLAALVFNFQIGSSIVFGLALDAKEDAWIALIIAFALGILITAFYLYLSSLLPGKNLYEMFEYCFKRPIAICLSLVYSMYFLYYACRIIRDFGELISATVLPTTPIEFSVFTLLLVIGYVLYLGLEVLARTSEIFTPYAVIFMVLLCVFLYSGKNLDLSNIKPILGEGFDPLWKVIFPYELIRPYGQLLFLTFILPSVTRLDLSSKVVMISVIFSSLLLIASSVLIILSLGQNIALRSNFPLLSAARLISIGEFIQRVDAIVVFTMVLGTLVKSSIYIYGGLKGLEYIFTIPFRFFAIPISCVVSLFSIFIAKGYSDHINEGLFSNPFLLHVPLQFGLPLLLTVILLFKKWRGKHHSKQMKERNM